MKRDDAPLTRLSRRAVIGGLASAGCVATGRPARANPSGSIRIDDAAPGTAISPWVYGSNEIGTMDGGAPSATLDRTAGIRARRLGGDLMTTYNWVNNASNAGKNYQHANGAFLLEVLGIPLSEWNRPAAVIEAMHDASLAMGAVSLVTVPIAGFVAADTWGVVSPKEAAPSSRFVPVKWERGPSAADPIDARSADIPQMISRLIARYGDAKSGRGITAFELDNEPGLWAETHPRIVRKPAAVGPLIERSITAATAIKALDPSALVFGPASWGATEMVNFVNAPDWAKYRHHGSFLDAYLAAFREASDRAGIRLLDALDVHWYPFLHREGLSRTENPFHDATLLNAPRSLTEPGFREDSWVSAALPAGPSKGVSLPLLPSLAAITTRSYPGTSIAITEFNYGGAARLASGLALADALGRFGATGVLFASHWGSLAGWLNEAYRLYRTPDSFGEAFGDRALPIDGVTKSGFAAFASRSSGNPERVQLIVINKSTEPVPVDAAFARGRTLRLTEVIGFDAATPQATRLNEDATSVDGAVRLNIPARAARRFVFQ